jgi:signal transduction histidine kinase/CheY-like chemotaxis protein
MSGENVLAKYSCRIKSRTGETIWVDVSAVRITWEGSPATLTFLRDVTIRKKLEEQLLQAQKMEAVGQLAGGIAHDFNNILTALMGYGHLLKIKMHEGDPLRSYADHILALSDKAANLTQGLLAFSRKQVLNPKIIELNEVIRKTDKFLSRIIGEDVRIQIALAEKELIVMADPGQIEQVLMNLAANARDAMPEGGLLFIGTQAAVLDKEFIRQHGYGKEGKYALIMVSDTGTGIDNETRKKIFEPFFTTKGVGKGTGLGLSMVYGIIKQHEGYVDVYSDPGKGTMFSIYLPLDQGAIDNSADEAVQTVERGTETVLLAEDDVDVRLFIGSLLRQYGYSVIEAADGEEAVRKFSIDKESIRLVLVDVIMPKMNGMAVCEEIRKMRPDIMVIVMSGYPSDIMDKKGVPREGTGFILKPVSPFELLHAIREMLDKHSSEGK